MGAFLAGALLMPPAAHAFTIEGGPQDGAPKFDLEEQAKNFRTGGDMSALGQREVDTPAGKLQFGVQSGSPWGGVGSGSAARYRQHFDRMLLPPQMQDR